MPRLLTIRHAAVAPDERAHYVDRLRERRRHFTSAECRFWVFENPRQPGDFVEFAEAGDEAHLRSAHTRAPGGAPLELHVYTEVEID